MNSTNMIKPRKFSWRGFTSLVVTAGFALMAATGTVLYFSPRGRTANWIGWEVLNLTKEEWTGVHVNLAIILLAAAVFHLIYNWKPFVSYLRSRLGKITGLRLEVALTLLVLLLAWSGSVLEFPPFGTVLAWEDDIKDYWEQSSLAPAPYPHADETALDEFCAESGLPLDGALAALRENGLSVADSSLSIGQIAERNGLVPAAVYEAVRSKFGAVQSSPSAHPGGATGRGTGSMTIAQACSSAGLDISIVLGQLNARGIAAASETRLFDVAPALGTTPGKVIQELRDMAK